VTFVVFTQREELRVDVVGLRASAARHFDCDLELEEDSPDSVRGSLARRGDGARATFRIRARPRTETDLRRATCAEQAGRAAGMAALAARCPSVWVVEPLDTADAAAVHTLCAVMASTALGPVLPPDDSTLYGVRGALARADSAAQNA
jgi:hypothetical protein